MRKECKRYTPEEKVSVLRRHLIERVPVSTLCEELQLRPTVFCHWLEQFFENGAAAFQRPWDSSRKREQERIAALEKKLRTKDEGLAELMEEHVALKKVLGRFEGPMGSAQHTRPGDRLHARLERAEEGKLPPDTSYCSKAELGLELIDQALAWELPRLPVVEPSTVVWTQDPNLPLPRPKKTGRPRQYPPLETLPRPQDLRMVAEQLPASASRAVAWRQGSRGVQRSRFARLQVWAAHGWRKQEHPPRVAESCWWNSPRVRSTRPSTGWRNWVRNPSGCGVWSGWARLAGGWDWITGN
jgi:transposase-like protein